MALAAEGLADKEIDSNPAAHASQEKYAIDRLRRRLKFARLCWRAIPSSAETTR